ncbi:zinc finger MYM-type protein 1-like [Clavelina lepadiformis]|uniref:zinc finger MYM-type protein 1-like n=1 Tax=Clavelina lepadiformis TaxID=159417 RepID=UPI004041DB63
MASQLSGWDKAKKKRKEAAEQEKLLAKIPKLSSYFGMRAASSQLPASDAIANSSAPEDQAKQDEPDEEREDKERESSAERAEVKGDAITGEALAQTLEDITNDLGQWGKINADTREYWAKKGSKHCQHTESMFEESARQYLGESFQRRCTKTFFVRTHPLNGEKSYRQWLCYSPSTGKVFCFACKLFGGNAVQATKFVSGGFDNWRTGESRIKMHESSDGHRKAMLSFASRQREAGRVDYLAAKQVEEERCYWRQIVKRLIDVLIFLAKRGLAIRGADEIIGSPHNGNYLGIIELLAEYDTLLASHIRKYANCGKGHISYLSSTICEELVQLMGQKVQDTILKEAKKAKYFSVSIDSTPDVSHLDQLTIVIRYVLPLGPVERFLTFLPMMRHTATHMASILLNFLKENGLDVTNCRGQSYDNASNMSGRYNGVQAIVKRECKYAAFIPCCNHSLNLVGDQAVNSCAGCTRFFHFVNGLYVFLSESTYRWQKLKNRCTLTLKGLSGTRWCERADAVKALVEGWKSIQEVLDELAADKEQKADTRNQADGFSRRMDELETAVMATAWNDILCRLKSTSISLQDPTVSLNTATSLLASMVDTIQFARDRFDVYEQMAIEKVPHGEYKAEERRGRKRKRMPDEGAANEENLTPRETFKTHIYLVMIDRLLAELEKRMKAYEDISTTFGFLSELTSLSIKQIENKAQNLVSSYPDDLEDTLVAELIQFAAFMRTQKSVSVNESAELTMYKLLSSLNLSQTFPNVEIALRIYLCLMVSNASGERSFSKLGIVKGELRSSMREERLNMLALMSIEHEVLSSLDCTDMIEDFALAKARKTVV